MPHIPFHARLFIQGAAVYVPHAEKPARLLVLFPSSQSAHDRGFRDPTDPTDARSLSCHRATVQYDARNRSPSAAGDWRSCPCEGKWIGVDTDSEVVPMKLKEVSYLPQLNEIASAAGVSLGEDVRSDLLNGSAKPEDFLAAGIYLDSGAVSPSSSYLGAWRFPEKTQGGQGPTSFTSVVQVELGPVTRFALNFRAFGSSEMEPPLELFPIGDELDVWIRHVCGEPEPPVAEDDACEKALPDADFILNFALASELFEVLQTSHRLIPKPIRSWNEGAKEGGPIGADCHRCMCSGTGGKTFKNKLGAAHA